MIGGKNGRGNWRLAHLPVQLAVSGGLLAAAAVAGGIAAGGTGVAGATAGVGVVVASYLVSTLLIAWADAVDPRLVLPVGLAAYVVKFSLIGAGMAVLVGRGWDGLPPMGVAVVAGVLAWTTTQIWWVVRHPPRLEYTPPATPEAGNGGTPA
jgi:hypothetical protein